MNGRSCWAFLFLALACRGGARAATETPVASAPALADSLVLTLADSTEVWLTVGRAGKGEDGRTCRERGVELRNGGVHRVVPLLFVTTPPREQNGVLTATLSSDCRALDSYVIDPVTAHPTKR